MTGQSSKSQDKSKFNIRVYGICINDGHVLLSDETFNGVRMTKFPGGGLHFGEGTIDCLKREAMEEFNREITILDHFYTTDFFQPALFFENTQLISIYYTIKIPDLPPFPTSETPIFTDDGRTQHLRWVSVRRLCQDQLTFPIDQIVAQMVRTQFGN